MPHGTPHPGDDEPPPEPRDQPESAFEWDIADDVEAEPGSDPLMNTGVRPFVRQPPQRRAKAYRPGQLQFTCAEGCAEGQTFVLTQKRTVLGRSRGADIKLDDPALSRLHIEIVLGPKQATLRDLKSRNGVFVNGKRVEETALRSGDTIRLGEVLLVAEDVPPREE